MRAQVTKALFVLFSTAILPVAVGADEHPQTQGCEWGKNGFTTCDCAAYVDPVHMEGTWEVTSIFFDWPSSRIEISDVRRNDERRVRWSAQSYRGTVKHGLGGEGRVTVLNVRISKCYPHTFVLKIPMSPDTRVDGLENTYDVSKDTSPSAYGSPIRYGFSFSCTKITRTAINSLSPGDISLQRVESFRGKSVNACPKDYMNRYDERAP